LSAGSIDVLHALLYPTAMAGSDATREPRLGGPVIVLVNPQLGENIGAAARAMWNAGLTELRLVKPREPWPNPRAFAASSGADRVIDAARLFGTLEEAVADLRRLYATTARPRDLVKPVLTPRQAVAEMRTLAPSGEGIGVLFGPERTGLESDQVALADVVITAPLNPTYASLNLAQAVLLVTYEWFQGGLESPSLEPFDRGQPAATRAELQQLFQHLEAELDEANFLFPPHLRPTMVRNIRSMLTRATLTEQEVRTLHGIITSLSGRKWQRRREATGDIGGASSVYPADEPPGDDEGPSS
jgi:tRNA/rRNA methyltransferase